MEVDQPGKPSKFPQITVVISGITAEQTKSNEEDAASMLNIEEGDQAAEHGGVLVHKDIAGILSRRTLALEVRIDKIEKEIRTLKSNFNARLTRIEDKMKTLLKGQEEILSKMQELEHIQPVMTQADGGLPAETPVASIPSDLEMQQSKRMRVGNYSAASSIMAQVLRARYRRPLKSNTRMSASSKLSLVKYYKMMQAKQVAQAMPSPVMLDETRSGSQSVAHELGFGGIGSTSGSHP